MLSLVVALLVAQDGATLFPSDFTLNGAASRQTLLLESTRGGLHTGALKDGTVYASSDPAVVKIEGSIAIPVGNGPSSIAAVILPFGMY